MSLAARSRWADLPPDVPVPPPGQDELPFEDGEPMESPKHRDQMILLIDTLQRHLGDRPDVYIGGNMGLYYSELQAKNNDFRAPDFFVVLNAVQDRERKSWVVWQEEGRRPDLVIELLSSSTESTDRGRKMQIYAGLGVAEYILYDVEDERLELYRLTLGSYERVPPEPDGDVVSQVLNLRLGVAPCSHLTTQGRLLRWKLPNGELLPTGDEAAEAERQRAEAEKQRAEAAEARAARLEALLRAMGADPGES